MVKKFLIGLIIVIIGMCGNVEATDLKTTLNIIQKSSEEKYLENNQGYISKTIVDSNSDLGEVTIELKLSNTAKEMEVTKETEVFIVLDDSGSMAYQIDGYNNRKEALIEASKKLVSKLLETNYNIKIGIVEFGSTATLKLGLSNDETIINQELEKLKKLGKKVTNIDAGIHLAQESFSKESTNKKIILLTDGVPTMDREGNCEAQDLTQDICKVIAQNTLNTIKDIESSGTNIIALMTGVDTSSITDEKEKLERELLEMVFGTENNSTVSKYFEISDADIESVICNEIFSEVIQNVQQTMNNIKIVDYFPKDITENFEFSYVETPNFGISSETIDNESRTITWDIDTLMWNNIATLKYKLKIKDIKNTELLNKIIATNEKVVLTYKDIASKDYTVTLMSSPQIQLSEVIQEQPDNTIAPEELPQTGISMPVIFSIIATVIIVIFMYIKCKRYKDIK